MTVFLGNRAVVLCANSLLGVHTVILDSGGAHVSARPVTLESHGDCMANTKENLN